MPVPEGKTIDLISFIGSSDWIQRINRVLDGGIPGDGNVTFEAIRGTRDEEASIHSVSQSFEFSTLYDGAETDTLMTHVNDATDPWCVMLDDDADLMNFEIAQVSLTTLPRTQPPDDSLTRSLSLPQSDRAYYGHGTDSVTEWTLDATNSSVSLPNIDADDWVFAILASTDVATPQLSIHNSTRTAASPSIIRLAQGASTSVTVSTTTSLTGDQEIKGWLLIGSQHALPTG